MSETFTNGIFYKSKSFKKFMLSRKKDLLLKPSSPLFQLHYKMKLLGIRSHKFWGVKYSEPLRQRAIGFYLLYF